MTSAIKFSKYAPRATDVVLIINSLETQSYQYLVISQILNKNQGEKYDFKGKTVIPLCSYASTYRDKTLARIAKLTPAASHLTGLGLTRGRISENNINDWLRSIEIIK